MKNHNKKTRYLANICRTHLIAERNEKTHRGAAKGNDGEKQQRGTTKNSRGREHHKKPRDAKSTQSRRKVIGKNTCQATRAQETTLKKLREKTTPTHAKEWFLPKKPATTKPHSSHKPHKQHRKQNAERRKQKVCTKAQTPTKQAPLPKQATAQKITRKADRKRAEGEGFEPSRRFRQHAFQACAIGQTRRPLHHGPAADSTTPTAHGMLTRADIPIAE